MFLNGILFNSEAWQNISEEEMKMFEDVDNHLLRKLMGAHSKTSIAFLHLETGSLPIRFVIANRRLVYYFNILSKPQNELILRVFKAQMKSPTKGDFFLTVGKDFELIGEKMESYNETIIKNMKLSVYKKLMKNKVRMACYEYLKGI